MSPAENGFRWRNSLLVALAGAAFGLLGLLAIAAKHDDFGSIDFFTSFLVADVRGASIQSVADEVPPQRSPINYEARVDAKQEIPLHAVRSVSIRCGCREVSVVRDVDAKVARVSVTGVYRIQGYYGTPEDAGASPPDSENAMFDAVVDGDLLMLTSKEWQHLHHSLFIESAQFVLPPSIAVSFGELPVGEAQ